MPTFSSILVIVIIVALVLAGPFITIAALNTLFAMSIPYGFWQWLSVVWLAIVFGGTASVSR